MPLHDTSFRKSAVSTKARKDRRFTRSGLRNIPNTQKSEKVRWGRGDLSGPFSAYDIIRAIPSRRNRR